MTNSYSCKLYVLLAAALLPVFAKAQLAADSARYMAIKGHYHHIVLYSSLYYKSVAGTTTAKDEKAATARQRYGLLDLHFREVLPCKYRDITNFTPGKFWVQDAASGKWGLVDTQNKQLLPFRYSDVRRQRPPLSLWTVEKDGLYYPVGKDGKIWTAKGYSEIKRISGNRYACRAVGTPDPDGQPSVTGSLFCMTDTEGHEFTPNRYLVITECGKDRFIAEDFGKKYLLDEQGKQLNAIAYSTMRLLPNKLFVVANGALYGLMDMNGHLVTAMDLGYISPLSPAAMWMQMPTNRKWVVLTNEMIPDTTRLYDDAGNYDSMCSIQVVKQNGRYGAVNSYGKEIIPCTHQLLYPFYGNVTIVKDENKYGCIDDNGRQVVPCIFNGAMPRFGTTWGQLSPAPGRYVLVNRRGILADTTNGAFNYVGAQWDEMTNVAINNKYGFIDSTGRQAVPLIYDYAEGFRNGIAPVSKDGVFGGVDKSGRLVVPMLYKRTATTLKNVYLFERNSWFYAFDADGKITGILPADIYDKWLLHSGDIEY